MVCARPHRWLATLVVAGCVVAVTARVAASADTCSPTTGSPPGELILGPGGEQFRPANEACPDDFVAPVCNGGVVLRHRDPDDPSGLTRYACASSPARASSLPLVVFLHPSRVESVDGVFGGAGRVPAATRILAQSTTTSLAPGTSGFLLLMPQGRCLRSPPDSSGDGTRFDVWYQDPARNLDVRSVRAFIQQLATRTTQDERGTPVALPASFGSFDPKRVYLMGWSNGAFLAHLLALALPDQFAAVATFAAGDPFARGPCVTSLPKVSRKIPIQVTQAECDPAMFCTETQAWIETLRRAGWSSSAAQLVITDSSKLHVVGACDQGSATQQRECPKAAHFTYANPQLSSMYAFLRQHALP